MRLNIRKTALHPYNEGWVPVDLNPVSVLPLFFYNQQSNTSEPHPCTSKQTIAPLQFQIAIVFVFHHSNFKLAQPFQVSKLEIQTFLIFAWISECGSGGECVPWMTIVLVAIDKISFN